jgi:Tfp pilus assembly protein FimT
MRKLQRGVTIMGLLIMLVLFILVALFAMKVLPSFMEFRTAKSAIEAVARQGATSTADVRRAFDNRATIDNIVSVRPQDLEITREGNSLVIGFAYRKEIPLFSGVGLYIDYAASSKGQ